MTYEEREELLRVHRFQFEHRARRLQDFYELNAPQQLIDEQIRILAKAGEMIAALKTADVEIGDQKYREILGQETIQRAFEAEHIEAHQEEENRNWLDAKQSITEQLRLLYPSDDIDGIVGKTFEALRLKGVLFLM